MIHRPGAGIRASVLSDQFRYAPVTGNWVAVNYFQIPPQPGLPQQFMLAGVPNYPSSQVEENELEQNYYGILALQGAVGEQTQLPAGSIQPILRAEVQSGPRLATSSIMASRRKSCIPDLSTACRKTPATSSIRSIRSRGVLHERRGYRAG